MSVTSLIKALEGSGKHAWPVRIIRPLKKIEDGPPLQMQFSIKFGLPGST